MPTIKKDILIKGKQGLHARPAAMFVQICAKYNSNVIVQKGNEKVNGRSIMGIFTLGAQTGSQVTIEATGDDAEKVLVELEELLTKDDI